MRYERDLLYWINLMMDSFKCPLSKNLSDCVPHVPQLWYSPLPMASKLQVDAEQEPCSLNLWKLCMLWFAVKRLLAMFLFVRMRRKRTDANGVRSSNSRWVALKVSLLAHMLLSSQFSILGELSRVICWKSWDFVRRTKMHKTLDWTSIGNSNTSLVRK